MCSNEVSPLYVFEYVESDVRDGGMLCHTADTCMASGVLPFDLAAFPGRQLPVVATYL